MRCDSMERLWPHYSAEYSDRVHDGLEGGTLCRRHDRRKSNASVPLQIALGPVLPNSRVVKAFLRPQWGYLDLG